jgi:hypothetical protein
MQQAQQDVDRVMAGIQAQYPAGSGVKVHAGLIRLKEEVIQNARPILRILLAAVAMILLIACANLGNLLLVKAAGRRREFGMRLALGAVRGNLFRQLLTESLLLSCFGAAIYRQLPFHRGPISKRSRPSKRFRSVHLSLAREHRSFSNTQSQSRTPATPPKAKSRSTEYT